MTVPKGSAVLPLGWQVNKPLLFDDRSSVLKLMMILVARAPTYFCTLVRFNKYFNRSLVTNLLFVCLVWRQSEKGSSIRFWDVTQCPEHYWACYYQVVNKPLLFDDRSSVLKLMMILVARAPTYFCTLMHFNRISSGV